MRCRSGDLAIVIGTPADYDADVVAFMRSVLIGKVVRVTRLTGRKIDVPAWYIEEPFHVFYHGAPILCDGIEDEYLTPLRGDLRGDETPVETNVPEALKLALGIESRSYA